MKIHDENVKESMGIQRVKTLKVSEGKVVKIDAISKEDERYLDFDYESAVQTPEFMGKHIAEFKKEMKDDIPEIYTLLFDYFDENPDNFKVGGLFRKSGCSDLQN